MALNVYQQFDESGTADKDKSEHNLVFLVVTDDAADVDIVDVINASDGVTRIPAVNETLPSGYRVTSKDWRRDSDNPNHFTVTVKVSDAVDDASQPTGSEKVNVDIRVSVVPYDEPVYLDRNKTPIVNQAGQPFTNQPTKTYYDEQITVSFQTGTVDQKNIDACRGKTNSAPINMTVKGYRRSFDTGTLKLIDTPISSRVIKDEYYWAVEYVLAYRADKWTRKILNMGRMQKLNNKLVGINDGHGGWVSEDVPLDKNGKAIVDGSLGVAKKLADAAAGDRVYLEFDIEDQASFGGLLSGVR